MLINRKKQHISSALRKNVWEAHVGLHTAQTLCQACYRETINVFNFECGHIIPESKGGELSVYNLKPISSSCNRSMATTNLYTFQMENGFHPPPGYLSIITSTVIHVTKISWNTAFWICGKLFGY